uniref:Uncharacterized protein n=1 Tax=Podoviridae sp. ctsfx1 TaxID=2825281 RepID=A0A8S5QA61_9CAUD|nr:MAG TPA: hypothetical protein [Podoviridae sp. ctsfx1]DAM94403.1 MAG TPA: hypothetical protein [Caudoviricetes sp.]
MHKKSTKMENYTCVFTTKSCVFSKITTFKVLL